MIRSAILAALALTAACRAPDPKAIRGVEVEVDPLFPTVLHVSWKNKRDAESGWVEYGLGNSLSEATPEGPPDRADVAGLKAGHTYQLRPVARGPSGRRIEGPVVEVEVAEAPMENFRVTIDDRSAQDPGRLLFFTWSLGNEGWAAAVDRDGDWVWWWTIPRGLSGVTSKPARSGRELLVLLADAGKDKDVSRIAHLPLLGGEVVSTRTLLGHHDFVELDGERFAWLAHEFEEREADGIVQTMRADAIYEGPAFAADEADAVEVFSLFEDLGRPLEAPCEHGMKPSDSVEGPVFDLTHGNSLAVSPDGTELYAHLRYLDALLAVERSSGALLWELGGANSDFVVTDDVELWSHGHATQMAPHGMVMFDNANHRDVETSGIVEYTWDVGQGEVSEVFRHDSPEGWEVGALGDVHRLLGGNYLVTWGSRGVVQEITPQGEVVWEARPPDRAVTSRFTLTMDLYDLRGRAAEL